MGGTLVRTIGPARAKARIGMKTLACNEEAQELIRGIISPTNAPPCPVAPHQPVPGLTLGADVRSRGPKLAMASRLLFEKRHEAGPR